MKKIAINTKHGIFSLSAKALKRYCQLCGFDVYFFKFLMDEKKYEPLKEEDIDSEDLSYWGYLAFKVPDPNSFLNYTDIYNSKFKPFNEMSNEEKIDFNKKYESIIVSVEDIKRDDPNLIQTIEELKLECNRFLCYIKIVEIPDDVDWVIEDYDGLEWVAEKHRTWS